MSGTPRGGVPAAGDAPGAVIPIGVNLTAIRVTGAWWLESARRLEAAGYASVWAWDHFISRGTRTDPMLECWTLLTAAAMATERISVGSFVLNVTNRHPAVLARMAATLADLAPGRVELGIGIGGDPTAQLAYGIEWPEPWERAARLEEAVTVLRLLFAGGPVSWEGRFFTLRDAYAFPAPRPAPRIIIGGETPAGARLGARIGDTWSCSGDSFDARYPVFLDALAAAGRRREEVSVQVAVDIDHADPTGDPLLADLRAGLSRWAERGADEVVLHWIRPNALEAVLAAGERSELRG